MSSGILDFYLSQVADRTIQLTVGCPYGGGHALLQIGDSSEVTLQTGRLKQKAKVTFRSGGECFADHFELNAALAKQLKLQGDRRYKLTYDSMSSLLVIEPSPVSAASSRHRHAAQLGTNAVSIGYELASRLGLPDRQGYPIQIKHGTVIKRLIVRTPSNLFDNEFKLSPANSRAMKLTAGVTYGMQFDQRSKTLVLRSRPASALPVK